MKPYFPLIVVLALIVGCGTAANSRKAKMVSNSPQFFTKWFEAHGHSDVVEDADGVGIKDNATRLKASLFDSKRQDNGGYIVEVEFTIRLPGQGSITEFVAGIGSSEQQAIDDALLNFTLTTFHVVYKAFINDSDPHMDAKNVSIAGVSRQVILGDIMLRGSDSSGSIDLKSMNAEITGALQTQPLSAAPHWVKIVYSQNNSQPMTVSVTLDNEEHAPLTAAITKLNWPRVNGFYMAKQFIVIR